MSNWVDSQDGPSGGYYQQQDTSALSPSPVHSQHDSHSQHSLVPDPEAAHADDGPLPRAWSFADTDKSRIVSRDHSPHATDEVFNSVSHLSAAMLSFLGTVLLIAQSRGNPWKIVGFSLYGCSLVFLFMCSALHHAISSTREVEARLRMLDYLAIYPLIAGTLTPFCLVFLHGSVIGWSFFGVVWFFALVGMFLTAKFGPERMPRWLTLTMYITLGWFGGIFALFVRPELGWGGLALFIGGGVAYTAGGVVYNAEWPNPLPGKFGFHEIWHIAVFLGAGMHYAIMYMYVLPWEE